MSDLPEWLQPGAEVWVASVLTPRSIRPDRVLRHTATQIVLASDRRLRKADYDPTADEVSLWEGGQWSRRNVKAWAAADERAADLRTEIRRVKVVHDARAAAAKLTREATVEDLIAARDAITRAIEALS